MFEFLDLFDKELAAELLFGLVFVIYVVVYSIDGLKKKGIIQPDTGQASRISEFLNGVLGLIMYVLLWLGAGAKADSIAAVASLAASSVVYIIAGILGSKVWYEALKWIRGVAKRDRLNNLNTSLQDADSRQRRFDTMDMESRALRQGSVGLRSLRGGAARRNEARMYQTRQGVLRQNLGDAFRFYSGSFGT